MPDDTPPDDDYGPEPRDKDGISSEQFLAALRSLADRYGSQDRTVLVADLQRLIETGDYSDATRHIQTAIAQIEADRDLAQGFQTGLEAIGLEAEVGLAETGRTKVKLVAEGRYEPPAHGWTCFHCGNTFHTAYLAQIHFGVTPKATPTCRLVGGDWDLARLLRKAEARAEAAETLADGLREAMLKLTCVVPGLWENENDDKAVSLGRWDIHKNFYADVRFTVGEFRRMRALTVKDPKNEEAVN